MDPLKGLVGRSSEKRSQGGLDARGRPEPEPERTLHEYPSGREILTSGTGEERVTKGSTRDS